MDWLCLPKCLNINNQWNDFVWKTRTRAPVFFALWKIVWDNLTPLGTPHHRASVPWGVKSGEKMCNARSAYAQNTTDLRQSTTVFNTASCTTLARNLFWLDRALEPLEHSASPISQSPSLSPSTGPCNSPSDSPSTSPSAHHPVQRHPCLG